MKIYERRQFYGIILIIIKCKSQSERKMLLYIVRIIRKGCSKLTSFNLDDAQKFAAKMKKRILGDGNFLTTPEKNIILFPVATKWQELFDILLE